MQKSNEPNAEPAGEPQIKDERRPGRTKLVYDKEKRAIVEVAIDPRVGAVEKDFRLEFSEGVAEGDFQFCEMFNCDPEIGGQYPDISNAGLDRLTDIASGAAEPLFERIAMLEQQLAEAQRQHEQFARDIAALEARLEAIDNALDDADAPSATDAHALDKDPIVERIKLWDYAFDALADNYETRLADANAKLNTEMAEHTREVLLHAVAKDRAEKAEAQLAEARAELRDWIENRGPTGKAEAEAAKLRAALVKVEAYMASEDGPLFKLWEDGDIGNDYDDVPSTDWEQTLFDIRDWKGGCVPTASLGSGTEWPVITLYREILAALEAPEAARGRLRNDNYESSTA